LSRIVLSTIRLKKTCVSAISVREKTIFAVSILRVIRPVAMNLLIFSFRQGQQEEEK